MNWKTDLNLSDLDPKAIIEITCKRCGYTRTETKSVFIGRTGLSDHLYFDEIEAGTQCAKHRCGGGVRIVLTWEDKIEGFVGGMP